MSAVGLIQRFGVPVTVQRRASGEYPEGRYQEGALEEIEVTMSIQPLSGRERLNLPEAQRTKRIYVGYCAEELRTVDEIARTPADRVLFDGTEFEVTRVEVWPGNLNHWKVELIEVNQ